MELIPYKLKVVGYKILIVNKRKTVSISLPTELLSWIEEQVASDIYIKDRSHLVEIAVSEFRERRQKLQDK